MSNYTWQPRNRFFEVGTALNAHNDSDFKVAMMNELDLSRLEELRRRCYAVHGKKPSYTALVATAVALAFKRFPQFNVLPVRWPWFQRLVQLHSIDISVGVERQVEGAQQASYVHTLYNTLDRDALALTEELREVAHADPETLPRWQAFRGLIMRLPIWLVGWLVNLPYLSPSLWHKHRGGGVLISSPAKYGVDALVGTWPWPIGFSFGLVKERAVVVDHRVEARPTMTLSMSFDRRLMGGAEAARFFREICDQLETASALQPVANDTNDALRAAANTSGATVRPIRPTVRSCSATQQASNGRSPAYSE